MKSNHLFEILFASRFHNHIFQPMMVYQKFQQQPVHPPAYGPHLRLRHGQRDLRGRAHLEGLPLHRDRHAVPRRILYTGEPVKGHGTVQGRHALLLRCRVQRLREEGEVQRQRGTLGHRRKAHTFHPQGGAAIRRHVSGRQVLRRDPARYRRTGPCLHRDLQARPPEGREGGRPGAPALCTGSP